MIGRPYRFQATIVAKEPAQLFESLFAHLIEHDVDPHLSDGILSVDLPAVAGTLKAIDGRIEVDVSCADLESLYFVKVWLQDVVAEDASQAVRIEWSESSLQHLLPPSFSVLTVDGVEDVTPGMRRIRFRTADTRSFDTVDEMHLRILFNFEEIAKEHAWRESRSGSPPLVVNPIWRVYTVRFVDSENHVIAVDFVMHDAEGPGCSWARRAKRGDVVGAAGPAGGGIGHAQWYLLAGDETALPAICRILESLDRTATATVVIEVRTPEDAISFTSRAAVEAKWLYRDADGEGRQGGLAQAIAAMDFPEDVSQKRFVWVACESRTANAIRATLRMRGVAKQEQSVAAYWHAA
ncbi:siderophore-interacting protein (plasmid) [Ensifer sp. D2-11]